VAACKTAGSSLDNPGRCDLIAPAGECDIGKYDKRSEELRANGCCPAAITTCLSINSLSADVTTINLTSGESANITGEISAKGGGTTNWAVIVEKLLEEEGGGYQTVNVLPGLGHSVSEKWDGKDFSGKQVKAGKYRVSLAARNTGGTCGDDSAFRSSATDITVKATPDWPICREDFENYRPMPSLERSCGSTVNFATGNLYHSQTLFTLPNSKFLGEFRLSYNSLSSQNDVLGMGWTHTYNVRLAANNDGSYTLTEGDGRKTVLYNKGSYYSPQNWNFPALTLSGGAFALQHKNGISYSFDPDKKITAISDVISRNIGGVAERGLAEEMDRCYKGG
jgi:hypothetical protein